MLYAWCGSGKSYVALSLGLALTGSREWLGYEIASPRPYRVLFIDGEMAAGELQSRIDQMTGGQPPGSFFPLSMELALPASKGKRLDLSKELHREAFLQAVNKVRQRQRRHDPDFEFDLIILDNLSALMPGVEENDNSGAVADLNQMLSTLRYAGISVLVVHHTGKSGEQRGASRREDPLDYSIALKKDDEFPGETHLTLQWDKVRGQKPYPAAVPLLLRSTSAGGLEVVPDDVASRGEPPAYLKTIRAILSCGEQPTTTRQIKERTGTARQTASRHIQRARDNELILGNVGNLRLTDTGRDRFQLYWPHEAWDSSGTACPEADGTAWDSAD
jgi:putative DNA primase/helicase